jgi:Xaa-Pro dipeptidase
MKRSIPYTDFPIEEYQSRVNRLRLLLDQAKIDAIIVSEYNNFRYFAGFDRPYAGWSGYLKTRPFLCFLPRVGDPTLFVHSSLEKDTNYSWIKDVRTWSSLPFRLETMKNFLKELNFDRDVALGFELGGEQRLGFPTQVYIDLMKSLPRVKFLDSSDILTALRLKKSPLEIECIRNSCKIMNQGYHDLFKLAKEGFSEKDIKFNLTKLLTVEESEGPNFVRPTIFPRMSNNSGNISNRKLTKGDLLWIDAGAIFKGYRSDFSRIAVVGKPSDEQMKYYKLIRDITFKTISSIRPGQAISDLVGVCNTESEKVGLPPKSAGRIGHGIGLDTAEAPSVMQEDPTILEPGNVITVEPGYLTTCGYFVLEEIVAVKEDGYRLLTDLSPEEPFCI